MRILVVSPHYDDAPLSLGQSMLDGALARHDVTVGVVFGRSNWVRWFYPTKRRTPLATAIRRSEEALNGRRFGYRVTVGWRSEALLRLGTVDTAVYLDPTFEPTASPELDSVERVVSQWASTHDAVLVPVGIGDHIDHQLVAAAGQRLSAAGAAVGFYVDRPYGCFLSDDQQAEHAARLGPGLQRLPVSGRITREKTRRLWYPSQFDDQFLGAMAHDEHSGQLETVFADDALVALHLG